MTATTAGQQIIAMRAALETVELEMVEAAGGPQTFSALEGRRTRMLGEISRLEFLARREAAEAHQAHLASLREQYVDAATAAAAVRAEGAAIDGKIRWLVAELDAMLREGGSLTRRHRTQETRFQTARSALVKAGEPLPEGIKGPGAWGCPDQAAAIAFWQAAHVVLGAAGLNPNSAAAQQPHKRRA